MSALSLNGRKNCGGPRNTDEECLGARKVSLAQRGFLFPYPKATALNLHAPIVNKNIGTSVRIHHEAHGCVKKVVGRQEYLGICCNREIGGTGALHTHLFAISTSGGTNRCQPQEKPRKARWKALQTTSRIA